MDGLLIDTEDIYTEVTNKLLAECQGDRTKMTWEIKAKVQGRPGPEATTIMWEWAGLNKKMSIDDYRKRYYEIQEELIRTTKPLPGVVALLNDLDSTVYWQVAPKKTTEKRGDHLPNGAANGAPNGLTNGINGAVTNGTTKPSPRRVHIALATSSHQSNFKLKTSHLEGVFSVFEMHRRVLGDDPEIPKGRGKPLPDIYLIALDRINKSLPAGEAPIQPEECLVFEDSVSGVEAGRRAGMRVVWVPHKDLLEQYKHRIPEVLAGQTGEAPPEAGPCPGKIGDGWAELLPSLENFPYEKYGIVVPPVEVKKEDCMKGLMKISY